MGKDSAMTSGSQRQSPSVAVVVVNFNGFEYTSECIDSLLRIHYDNYRIVMVDNGSKDRSGALLAEKYAGKIVPLLLPVNGGVTGGNNAGIRYAAEHAFDFILFLNNDTVVDPSFLSALVSAAHHEGAALAVPKIVCFFDRGRLDHWVGSSFDWWTGRPAGYQYYPPDAPEHNIRAYMNVSSTCCLLVAARVIEAIGGMDENYFMYYDDADFTLRATRAGFKMVYEPAGVIFHKCNKTTSTKQPSYFEFYLINRNVFYFFKKLCDKPLIKYAVLTWTFSRLVLYCVVSILRRDRRRRAVLFMTMRDILRGRMGHLPDEFFREIAL